MTPAADELLWGTYLGRAEDDRLYVDGHIYMAGSTRSALGVTSVSWDSRSRLEASPLAVLSCSRSLAKVSRESTDESSAASGPVAPDQAACSRRAASS